MIEALAIGVVLLLAASVYFVRLGCCAIVALCADLERDRQVEYQHPVASVPARKCPEWIRRSFA